MDRRCGRGGLIAVNVPTRKDVALRKCEGQERGAVKPNWVKRMQSSGRAQRSACTAIIRREQEQSRARAGKGVQARFNGQKRRLAPGFVCKCALVSVSS